jgi:hypothetical protein
MGKIEKDEHFIGIYIFQPNGHRHQHGQQDLGGFHQVVSSTDGCDGHSVRAFVLTVANKEWVIGKSLYSVIGDFFIILRLLHDMVFKQRARKTYIYIYTHTHNVT